MTAWNPERKLDLRRCFVREFGEVAAAGLVQYAEGLNGQAEPGVPIALHREGERFDGGLAQSHIGWTISQ